MSLFKRFRSYIIGVLLGILMVMIIFKDKANLFTSWLPENRVLLELSEKKITTTPKTACVLNCIGKTEKEIQDNFLTATSVEFSKSNPQATPREYCLIQEIGGVKTQLMVNVLDSSVTLQEIKSEQSLKCDCQTLIK